MDREEAIKLLRSGEQGVVEWNRRRKTGEAIPDLRETDLNGADLRGARLDGAYLRGAQLGEADLGGAQLGGADLGRAYLRGADLVGAHLVGAQLGEAVCGGTVFSDVDLSDVKGLITIKHEGPSTVGIDTLFRSGGEIPEAFLRGCGVPEALIVQQRALVGSLEPVQFYSCFISYSTEDQDFAEELHSRLRDKGLRVWFAPEDVKGGEKLHEQIDEAIRLHDKLLLVLSPESMASESAKIEIRNARKAEVKERRRKLFPLRLVDYQLIKDWSLPDSTGQDLAEDVRQYFIPDFSGWKKHDAFEGGFARLLRDLEAKESTGKKPG